MSSELAHRISELFPGGELVAEEPVGADDAGGGKGSTSKAAGYGTPRRLRVRTASGEEFSVAFRAATADAFGHDRRADRAAALLLDFDTFGALPHHVRPLDVGAVDGDGRLLSLAKAGEFYLLTRWADGTPYAEDLRRIARGGAVSPLDLRRCRALAECLVELHTRVPDRTRAYARSVRDLLGHGEGIFGMVDGYPADTPAAPPARLRRLEARCLDWRWRLRERTDRLSRIHGDFHPFNVVFADGQDAFTLLDASRGCLGDPADDVTAMAVNFLFFGMDSPDRWHQGFGQLWSRFLESYLSGSGDTEVLKVAPPFLAWRMLVVCHPHFYPNLTAEKRDALLSFAERRLEQGMLSVSSARELFP